MGVAARVAEALDNYSEGQVASVVEQGKDTAQSWKLGRRAPNSAAMLVAEEADLGRFFDQDSRIRKILERKALQENQEGQFARAFLREIQT